MKGIRKASRISKAATSIPCLLATKRVRKSYNKINFKKIMRFCL